jgi:glucokinase
MKAIGIDIGGTRIKSAVMNADGLLLEQFYTATNDGNGTAWKQAVKEIVTAIRLKAGNEKLVLGIAAPGLPDESNTAIACMPGRMQGLEHFLWNEFLALPAWVLNDAVAALVAEAKTGVAKNKKNVVLLTLGTGVGGAILINGKPYQGAFAKAGHIGHMVINDEGDCDVTGMPGSLEECIGNCTVEKRSKGKFSSTQQLLDAYHGGDVFAKQVWLKSVKQLAIGLSSVTNIVSPEMIVLGGGITAAGAALFEPLQEYMTQFEWRAGGNKTEIVKAALGDMAGAAGAAYFAMENN